MDSISTSTLFSILIILILISGYFSGSETAMMSLNRYRLKHLAKQGNQGAKRVEELLSRPDRLIGLILIGNNLVNILASAIATILGMRIYGDMGVAIATGMLTLVVLVFAEVTPKTLAAQYPERVSFISSLFLNILMKLLAPLVLLVNLITNSFIRLLGLKSVTDNDDLSSEELRTVVNEAGNLIPNRHQEMLISILDLEHITVNDVMVPRNEIEGIDINDDWKSILRQISHSPHRRLVLYRDQVEEVVGILRLREAYRLMLEKKNGFNKETLLRAADEVYFIPENTPLNVQIQKFQRNNERIGLVVDEYGDIIGMVTIEDILEEIIGEFTTSITPSLSEEITPQGDGSYLIEASANIRDINKSLKWKLPTNGPRTLNGLVLEVLEEIPAKNQIFIIAEHIMEVVEAGEHKVELIKVFPVGYKKERTLLSSPLKAMPNYDK